MTTPLPADDRLRDVLDRLVALSEKDYYNPYQLFHWPDALPEDGYWMTPELLSVHGTAVAGRLSEPELRALSKWESVNFYSLNVHGIRELIGEVVARIHTPAFAAFSEYFHHLVGEENEHMWFFATFCLRYGGTIYPDRSMPLGGPTGPGGDADHFLVFARLLLFEEIVDHYNKRMADDERLHPTVRRLNAVHHQDESRHVAFGRQVVSLLHRRLRDTLGRDELGELERYLKRYLRTSVEALVNPAAYRDAGIAEPYRVREQVLADPGFRARERQLLKRSMSYLVNEGIFADDRMPA